MKTFKMTPDLSPDSPRQHSLPMDVEYEIIDRLYDDKPTLVSCSLVCHGWQRVCQAHLFHNVTLRVTHGQPADTFYRFLHFLQEAREHIVHSVKVLKLKGYTLQGYTSEPETDAGALFSPRLFQALLATLPRIRHLELEKLAFISEEYLPSGLPSFQALPPQCSPVERSIDAVHIRSCIWKAPQMTILDFLSTLSCEIGELVYTSDFEASFRRGWDHIQADKRNLPTVRSLILDGLQCAEMPVLSNLIRQSGSAGGLLINVTFGPRAVGDRAVGDINAFNDFLGVAGPYLVSLRLQFSPLLLEGHYLGKHQDANLS